MPPATGDHSGQSRVRSSANIDAGMFQVLYELERRLDEKFRESREMTKDDIDKVLAPVLARLDEGNRKFGVIDARLNEHSDTIENAVELANKHRADCPGANGPRSVALTKKVETSSLKKFGVNVGAPLLIAVLAPLGTLWFLVQIKLVAVADTSTNAPAASHQPTPATTGNTP